MWKISWDNMVLHNSTDKTTNKSSNEYEYINRNYFYKQLNNDNSNDNCWHVRTPIKY